MIGAYDIQPTAISHKTVSVTRRRKTTPIHQFRQIWLKAIEDRLAEGVQPDKSQSLPMRLISPRPQRQKFPALLWIGDLQKPQLLRDGGSGAMKWKHFCCHFAARSRRDYFVIVVIIRKFMVAK